MRPTRAALGSALVAALTTAGGLSLGDRATANVSGTVTKGIVTNVAGDPVPGATLLLSPDRPTPPRPGETDETPILDTTVTASDGSYALQLPESFTGAGYTDSATGLVRFNVFVTGPVSDLGVFEMRIGAPAARMDLQAGTDDAAPTNPEAYGDVPFTDNSNLDPIVEYADDSRCGPADGICKNLVKDLGRRWVVVGSRHSTVDRVRADFRYGNGANSSLSIGFSQSGNFGTFELGSEQTEESTATVGFPTVGGKNDFSSYDRTLFRYKLFHYRSCPSFSPCNNLGYKAEPVGWAGGVDQVHGLIIPNINKCVPAPEGSTFERTNSTAITWRAGASLVGAIGLDLTSRTGYSSNAYLHFEFNANRSLCGRQFPGQNPYILKAAPWAASH